MSIRANSIFFCFNAVWIGLKPFLATALILEPCRISNAAISTNPFDAQACKLENPCIVVIPASALLSNKREATRLTTTKRNQKVLMIW